MNLKNLIYFSILSIFLISCGEEQPTSEGLSNKERKEKLKEMKKEAKKKRKEEEDKIVKLKKDEKPTWKKYLKYCGKENFDREDNFEHFKKRKVKWHGQISRIKKVAALEGHGKWEYEVFILKMDPSESNIGDVELRVPKSLKTALQKYKVDHVVQFEGEIAYIGDGLKNHIVEITSIKKYVAERTSKKKKKK